jgi:hypothetical protein
VSIKVTVNANRLQRVLKRDAFVRYGRLQRKKVDFWLMKLRDGVRQGNFFDNPTPNLQQRVWAGKAKGRGHEVWGSAGWGSSYGPILEEGVTPKNQAGWAILPKKGKALRFLSQQTGKVEVRKGVWHPWKYGDKGSRPHWEPVLRKYRKEIEQDLGETLVEAMRGR